MDQRYMDARSKDLTLRHELKNHGQKKSWCIDKSLEVIMATPAEYDIKRDIFQFVKIASNSPHDLVRQYICLCYVFISCCPAVILLIFFFVILIIFIVSCFCPFFVLDGLQVLVSLGNVLLLLIHRTYPRSSQPFITIHKVIQGASHRDQSTFTCKNDDPVVLIWNPMKPDPQGVEVATIQWWKT